jgi:hypothetical protein
MSSADYELCRAAESGNVAEIERLIAAGADANAVTLDYFGAWTPLQKAAKNGHLPAIAALLAAGARVDGASKYGSTPLMVAARYGQTAAIDALLAAGADVHHAGTDGDTALHWASRHGHLDATRMLLEPGAKADVRNKEGKRPIDVVRAPLAHLLRLRDRITPLHRRVTMRRCAWDGAPPSPRRLPSAPCSPPLPPGPAAGPSRSPATGWSGRGRREARGGAVGGGG